jgi:hypothetical protein
MHPVHSSIDSRWPYETSEKFRNIIHESRWKNIRSELSSLKHLKIISADKAECPPRPILSHSPSCTYGHARVRAFGQTPTRRVAYRTTRGMHTVVRVVSKAPQGCIAVQRTATSSWCTRGGRHPLAPHTPPPPSPCTCSLASL